MFFTGVFGPITPFLVVEFGLSASEVGLLSSAIYAGAILLALPMGKFVDRRGTRQPIIIGTLLIPLLLFLLSRSTGLWMMLIIFLVSGFPRSLILPATEKAVAETTVGQERALAMGLVHSGPPLAGSFISAVVPALAVALSWRAGIGLLALGLIPAFFLLRSMLVRLPLSDQNADDADNTPPGSILKLIPDPRFLLPTIICGLFQGGHIIILSFFVLYLAEVLHLSPVTAGMLLATAQLLAVMARPSWGLISDRWLGGRRDLALVIMGISGAVSLLVLAFLPESPSLALLIPLAVTIGVSVVSARPMISTFAIEKAGIEDAGKISAILLVSTWGMFILMPIIFGSIVTVTGSWTASWIMAATLLAAGGMLPAVHRRPSAGEAT